MVGNVWPKLPGQTEAQQRTGKILGRHYRASKHAGLITFHVGI
jgi:hypothetical protein